MSDLGVVHLVGAGPGDPQLLTLRAASLLSRADVVVYDRLVHADVLNHVRYGARLFFVGKEGGGERVEQDAINQLLITQARLGREVVRLKGGDPFVFGRGGEEALALARAGVAFTVVPGVSAGIAAPAAAGIPVTHRGLATSVTFATGTTAQGDAAWSELPRTGTLVLFMAGRKLAQATAGLISSGRSASTPAAVVESGTLPSQRTIAGVLGDIAERAAMAEISSPALLVVGDVVSLAAELGESDPEQHEPQRSTP